MIWFKGKDFQSGILRVVLIFLLLSTSKAFSQVSQTGDDTYFIKINEDVKRLLKKHLKNLVQNKEQSSKSLDPSFYQSNISDSLQDLNSEWVEASRRRIAKDIGVQWNINYINNLTNGFGDLGFFYSKAANTGVEWNLFKGGFIDNRFKSKEFYYDQRIKQLQNKDQSIVEENTFLYNKILDHFLDLKRSELESWMSFTNDHIEISKNLYYKKLILWDDLLKLYSQQNEITSQLENYSAFSAVNDSTNSTVSDFLPLLKINYDKLVAGFREVRNSDSAKYLHDAYLKYKYDVIRDLSLKPFVRYNYYDYTGVRPGNASRDFVSTGFQFSVPLPLRLKESNELKNLESKKFTLQNNYSLNSDIKELNGLYFEYQTLANQYSDLHYQKLILEEIIRREQVKGSYNDPDYSPVYIIKQINEWYRIRHEMIIKKEGLYFLLIKMRSLTPGSQITDFTYEVDLEPKSNNNSNITKSQNLSVYIWSKTFEEYSNKEILKEVKANNFKKVILSINGNDSLKIKALELAKLLSRESVELHLMIGNNQFIYPQNKDAFIKSIEYLLEVPGIAGIHLDIEPHTIPTLKEDREKYGTMYVKMVETARAAIKDKKIQLSLSLPLFYEKDKLEKIYQNADKVYLMAYENPNEEFIKRKVAEELAINKSKTVIALRGSDFNYRNAMNVLIQNLSKTLEVSEFALHDLKSIKSLK